MIDKQSLSEEIKKMMETIPLNLDKIGSTLGIENNGYLSSTPPKLHHLFSELYEALDIEQIGYFKIKAIELLYHIDQLSGAWASCSPPLRRQSGKSIHPRAPRHTHLPLRKRRRGA